MDAGVVVDNEFIKWFATLGVGGVLAAFMFHFYRKDVRQYTDQWRGQSELLIGVIKENTSVLTRLVTVIDALHRRIDREEDVVP
jgi:hypothetical protein